MFLLFELKLFHIHRDKLISNEQKMSSTNFLIFYQIKTKNETKIATLTNQLNNKKMQVNFNEEKFLNLRLILAQFYFAKEK